jgi:hypothetical protein
VSRVSRILRSRVLLAALIAACGAIASSGVASAAPRVPQGFVGMMADGPLLSSQVNLGQQLDRMVASGVESIRTAFSWADAQPYRSWADVPAADKSRFENVNGVPTDFAASDRIVGLAAQRGLSVLPVVLYAPGWDAAQHPAGTFASPRSPLPFGNFMGALVRRYGPNGSFWRLHPASTSVPIRMWEIWNEPDQVKWWPAQPFAPGYVALMGAAHHAIKSADPGGKVVLAGMPNYAWLTLAEIYAVPGARHQFDVVGVHPYTTKPSDVIKFLSLMRQTMDRHGDSGKPLLASEIGWPSSLGKAKLYGFETNEAGQASRLAALMPLLASHRRALGLLGFDYYTWLSDEHPGVGSFGYAGLFRYAHHKIVAKPAFSVFSRLALQLEGCRVKTAVATRCAQSG